MSQSSTVYQVSGLQSVEKTSFFYVTRDEMLAPKFLGRVERVFFLALFTAATTKTRPVLLAPFVLSSIVGRGTCFFLVAARMRGGSARMDAALRRYGETLVWIMVLAVLMAYRSMP